MTQPLLIAVMGRTGSGKSSFINAVAGDTIAVVGKALISETSEVVAHNLTYKGRDIILVDTPGFDGFRSSDMTNNLTNEAVLEKIADFMAQTLQLDCKFSGVIYTHNITWTRIGRSSAREMNLFREICGEHASKNVTVATTFWDFLETAQTGETREAELKKHFTIFSGVKFERCGMTQSGEPLVGPRLSTPCSIIDRLIGLQPTDLALREDLANLRKLSETRPGLALSAEVEEMRTEFAVRINAMEERIASVQPAQIDLLRNEIEKLREQVEQLQNQQRRLKNIPIFDWRNVKQEMRGFFKRFFA